MLIICYIALIYCHVFWGVIFFILESKVYFKIILTS